MTQWRLAPLAAGLLVAAASADFGELGRAATPQPKRPKPGPRHLWAPDADHWRVERWAGNETSGGYLQGPALEAGVTDISRPRGMAFDPEGNAVFCTHSCLVMRTRQGRVRFLAGVPGVMGHRDGRAPQALFCHPEAAVHDGAESFFLLDRGNFCIRRLYRGPKGWLVRTVAGVPGQAGRKDGPAAEALFTDPCNLVQDVVTHQLIKVLSPQLKLLCSLHVDDCVINDQVHICSAHQARCFTKGRIEQA